LLSSLVLDPASIGEDDRRLDLPFRDRPVGPQQVLFVALRNDDESVPPIEVDRPRRIGPGADQYRLAREIFDITKKLRAHAFPLRGFKGDAAGAMHRCASASSVRKSAAVTAASLTSTAGNPL